MYLVTVWGLSWVGVLGLLYFGIIEIKRKGSRTFCAQYLWTKLQRKLLGDIRRSLVTSIPLPSHIVNKHIFVA